MHVYRRPAPSGTLHHVFPSQCAIGEARPLVRAFARYTLAAFNVTTALQPHRVTLLSRAPYRYHPRQQAGVSRTVANDDVVAALRASRADLDVKAAFTTPDHMSFAEQLA